jgi:S-adenosylmethionine synthetase
VAKNLVASGLCDRCEVQIAYAIGVPEPVSVMVDSKRTGKVSDDQLTRLVRKHFDLTPHALIKNLKLRRPIYRSTAAYGHFGRSEATFTWEKTDKAKLLARSVS